MMMMLLLFQANNSVLTLKGYILLWAFFACVNSIAAKYIAHSTLLSRNNNNNNLPLH